MERRLQRREQLRRRRGCCGTKGAWTCARSSGACATTQPHEVHQSLNPGAGRCRRGCVVPPRLDHDRRCYAILLMLWNLDTPGDFVMMRSNGQPVYNFCVTIDDATMQISHVSGVWISNAFVCPCFTHSGS